MKTRRFFLLIQIAFLFVALIPHTSFSASDESTQNKLYWLNFGPGLSTFGSMGGSASINVQMDKFVVSLSSSMATEEVGLFSSGDEFMDVGLCAGLASRSDRGCASLLIGLARVTGSYYVKDTGDCWFFCGQRKQYNPTLGLVLQSRAFLKLSRIFGAGIVVYSDFNKHRNFGGLTLNLFVGKLR